MSSGTQQQQQQQQKEQQQDPPWSRRPTKGSLWKLVEIKSGVQVGEHELGSRACTVLGRAADAVDVALLHASCSRRHARIAFDSSGTAWLRDLGSAHGTSVNKKPVPPEACGPHESRSTKPGARGVVIYPGDIVQFGASSRIFCVEGPPECSRAAAAAAAAKAKAAATTATTTTSSLSSVTIDDNSNNPQKKNEEDEGVNWGISMDADDVDDGGDGREAPSSAGKSMDSIDDDKIPDKQRKEYDRIKALKYKLENVRTESERIRRKQIHEELTAGQERQLERNQERISALQEEIGRKEDALWRKLHPDEAAPKRSGASNSKGGDAYVDEDEVDDRTNRQQDSSVALDQDGETEQSLTRKWKGQWERLGKVKGTLLQAKDRASQLRARASLLGGDDEEAFFAENEYNLAKEKVQKLQSEHDAIGTSLSELERLLKVANPKLTVDAEMGYIGIGPPMLPPPNNNSAAAAVTRRGTGEEGGFFPPPAVVTATTGTANSLDDEAFAMPAPRRATTTTTKARDAREAMPKKEGASSSSAAPCTSSPQHQQQQQPSAKRRKRALGPSMPPEAVSQPPSADNAAASRGTLAMMLSATSSSPATASSGGGDHSLKRKDRQQKDGQGHVASSRGNKSTKLPPQKLGILDDPDADPRNDVWHAPKDQDGSGRTKLNKKFEGRY